jgi:hypothetical protein
MLPDLSNDLRWRKSSASGGEGGQCVELHGEGAVRDSKNPSAGVLLADLSALVRAVKTGIV